MNTLAELRSGALQGAKRVRLSCGLSEFPEEIFTLADTLEILDLSGNALSSLPDDLPRLHRLRIIFCSDNQFTCLPEVLGRCAQLSMIGFKANQIATVPAAALPPLLRWLILTDNQIVQLPAELGRCGLLQKLALAGNLLSTLPEDMVACSRLELLRISANNFAELPVWLLSLPRLSWLAYAGNPFAISFEQAQKVSTQMQSVLWEQLTLKQQLGQGASGVIYQAAWNGFPDDVAIKLFKGALTSDGLPLSEMIACVAAGQHPNLISVLGKLEGHPSGLDGLVMSLVGPDFINLASPPSWDSCTRDVYSQNFSPSLLHVLSLAEGVAAAAQYLHSFGIMHGDLYGHNVLHCGQGNPLLGDFGAASFYDLADQSSAEALQRLEVRAFGCLLEELIERCELASVHPGLCALQARCLSESPAERPLFDEIVARLLEFDT